MRPAYWSALLLLGVLAGGWLLARQPASSAIRGQVSDGQRPVVGARVRFQGQCPATLSNDNGCFQLPASARKAARVTAWKEGYAIASAPADRSHLNLSLSPLPTDDNEDYAWQDPAPDPRRPNNCGNCHGAIYDEWSASAHADAAKNRHFRNLFEGSDWHGRPSLRWNVLAEHPLGAGVCAACHAPTLRDPTLAYDVRRAAGVDAHGVHCDYCHKVVEAPTDRLGTRFGRDGLRLLRPAGGQQLSFGPLDDAYREGEAFGHLPLYKESRFCASCHEGVVFGVHVYGTYSEWLESPARRRGQHCQSCHMTPSGQLTNIAPGKGGVERDPQTLASHRFLGGQADELRRCLSASVQLRAIEEGMRVAVEVQADNVGHRVPTGFIDRNLVLLVEAFDRDGRRVALQKGPTLPAAAGKSVAGQAGWLFAKRLEDADGRSPIPFWLPHASLTDTRLTPDWPDLREFTFAAGVERVRVCLLYRRFWQDVADAKGWPENEITVVDRSTAVGPRSPGLKRP